MMDFSKINYRTFFGRLVRLPLRLIPKSTVMPILQGSLKGKKWVVGAGSHGYWLGSYEIHKRIAFEREINPGMVIYDIGANVGFYSLLGANLAGSSGKVVAFEPFHRNVEYIQRHIELNKFHNIDVLEVAVSNKSGKGFFEAGGSIATGHLSEQGSIEVRTITLDEYILEGTAPKPDVIKVDVEGAEHEVFKGAQELIQKWRPLIFLDTHGREAHEGTVNLLSRYGYQFETLDGLSLPNSKELIARPL